VVSMTDPYGRNLGFVDRIDNTFRILNVPTAESGGVISKGNTSESVPLEFQISQCSYLTSLMHRLALAASYVV
jgi:hypothetical protein